MRSYTIEFNGTGEVCEGYHDSDNAAELWLESVLTQRGYDPAKLFAADWDANGENDNGQKCERMLFWENETVSQNDSGANAICQLCVVRD